jgi:hypothetical protein
MCDDIVLLVCRYAKYCFPNKNTKKYSTNGALGGDFLVSDLCNLGVITGLIYSATTPY